MAYTSKTKVENFLRTTIPSSLTTTINDYISAVKLYIDRYCGKTFEYNVAEVRYYDAVKDQDDLLVDDFVGTPTIELLSATGNSERTLTTDDYILYPLNFTVKNSIHLLNADSFWIDGLMGFGNQRKRVKVTANFGYSQTVPADIELAATQLVAKIYNNGSADGAVQSETLGDYSVSYQDVEKTAKEMGITSILDGYRDLLI